MGQGEAELMIIREWCKIAHLVLPEDGTLHLSCSVLPIQGRSSTLVHHLCNYPYTTPQRHGLLIPRSFLSSKLTINIRGPSRLGSEAGQTHEVGTSSLVHEEHDSESII